MDDQQRAREPESSCLQEMLQHMRKRGWIGADIESLILTHAEMDAAALRAAPEGFVMVPVEPTEAMVDRATWEEVGGHCRSCTAWPASHSDARRVWAAMLAARPQGVKDV